MNTNESYQSYRSFFKVYVLPHLPTDKKIKILDIGCGAGHLLYALQKEGYTNCLGIDSSKEQIDKAKKKLECVELSNAFQYLPQHKNEFNVITLFDVAEHFDKNNLFTLLKEINSSLQSSGILIIHTLNGWSPFSRFYFFGDLAHQQLYSPKIIGDMAPLANFKEYYYFPSAPEYLRKPESITSPQSLFRFFLRLGQWIFWRLVSRLYGIVVYIAIGKHPKVYTPNFIIVCKK
jgi:2-polyprenyl-3-methyl-5-hydroxy-6-metoxy-1,4-benzoquinol methylase